MHSVILRINQKANTVFCKSKERTLTRLEIISAPLQLSPHPLKFTDDKSDDFLMKSQMTICTEEKRLITCSSD